MVSQLSVLEQDNLVHLDLCVSVHWLLSTAMYGFFSLAAETDSLKKKYKRGNTQSFKEHKKTAVQACDIQVCASIYQVLKIETICVSNFGLENGKL